MARTPMRFDIPDPPPDWELSNWPGNDIDEAVEWYKKRNIKKVTKRYLKTNTDSGELKCQIVAGRRMYSTAELWRFIVTRPSHTAGKRNPAGPYISTGS